MISGIDLTARKQAGEEVHGDDILKHRNDVFRLAATLPGEPGPELPAQILTDLIDFLRPFAETAEEWPAILASLRASLGGNLKPATLRSAVQSYFRLA